MRMALKKRDCPAKIPMQPTLITFPTINAAEVSRAIVNVFCGNCLVKVENVFLFGKEESERRVS